MTQFLQRNELPIPPLLAVWRGNQTLPPQLTACDAAGGVAGGVTGGVVGGVAGGAACCSDAELPLFVKACHITQVVDGDQTEVDRAWAGAGRGGGGWIGRSAG